mmetsp:Transcript_114800/g.199672  ORF Transcript_114800/g.199672 Transcript_114800/m.199672 type:complete len:542 (-) Transcript_114800:788-2413(-)
MVPFQQQARPSYFPCEQQHQQPAVETTDTALVGELIHKLFHPDAGAVPIIHPDFKALGRLWIPWQFVVRTSGLDRFLSNHPHAPSLCVLFQNGRCNSRDKCNQIHVEVSFAALISQALHVNAVSNCCRMHGDLGSASRKNDIFSTLKTNVIEIRMPDTSSLTVSTERIAVTFFWNRFVKEKRRVLFFSPDRVCNLHQKNQCKYGVECKNVHVCRQFWSQVTASMNGVARPGVEMDGANHAAAYPNLRTPVSMPNAMALNEALAAMTASPHEPIGSLSDMTLTANKDKKPMPKARASCALAIVDPTSGHEVVVKKPTPEVPEPVEPSERVAETPGPVGPPKSPPPQSPLSPINTAAFSTSGASSLFSFPSVFAPALEDAFSPVSAVAPTLPSSPWGHDGDAAFSKVLQDLSLQNSLGLDAEAPKGETTASMPGKSHGLRLTIHPEGHQTPPSSDGSPANTPGPVSPAENPFQSRPFPKAVASPLAAMVSPKDRPTMQEDLAWLLKSEASRGKYKGLSSPLLGVAIAEGPDLAKGFGMGRGWM